MSPSARSVFVFGLYLIGVGFGLLALPDLVLRLLGFPPSGEVWPRVVGVLALVLAYYYLLAARAGLTGFFRWTVQARVAVFVVFAALVLCRLAPWPLVLVGAADLIAAMWTAFALRREAGRV